MNGHGGPSRRRRSRSSKTGRRPFRRTRRRNLESRREKYDWIGPRGWPSCNNNLNSCSRADSFRFSIHPRRRIPAFLTGMKANSVCWGGRGGLRRGLCAAACRRCRRRKGAARRRRRRIDHLGKRMPGQRREARLDQHFHLACTDSDVLQTTCLRRFSTHPARPRRGIRAFWEEAGKRGVGSPAQERLGRDWEGSPAPPRSRCNGRHRPLESESDPGCRSIVSAAVCRVESVRRRMLRLLSMT
jgi:hypothetical protein